LANQASYVRGSDNWMLSTFVLPVARMAEAIPHLSLFTREAPLLLSALGPRSETAGEFVTKVRETAAAIRDFTAANLGVVTVVQLEMPLSLQADEGVINEARGALSEQRELQVFWEAPAHVAEDTIDLLADHNADARDADVPFGYKLRTGGVAADAFPSSAQIARALVAATSRRVPIKFTAGLHHPVRQYRDEVKTKMHGFLNVLGAGVLAAQHRWSEKRATEMLESETAGDFQFDENSFRWRDWSVTTEQIAEHRRLITSFGSCSFEEPREDLSSLKLF
jgi:hypothetical protein